MEAVRNLQESLNLQEVFKRAVKYLVEGLAVAFVAYYVPRKVMSLQEIATIAVTAAATFAGLDMWAPSVSSAARQGAGFGVGANLVGFPQ